MATSNLPAMVVVGTGMVLDVVEAELPFGHAGVCDCDGRQIVIEARQPKVVKHATLLQGLLTLVNNKLVNGGFITPEETPSEQYIEDVSSLLLLMLVLSDLWEGVTPTEATEWVAEEGRGMECDCQPDTLMLLEQARKQLRAEECGDIIQAARWLSEGKRVTRPEWRMDPKGYLYLDEVDPGDNPTVFWCWTATARNSQTKMPWNPSPEELLYTDYVRCE